VGGRFTIVGVLADARRGRLDERPIAQIFGLGPTWNVSYVLRARNDAPLSLAASVRSALAAVDPNVAVSWMAPAQDLIDDSLTLWRLRTLMAALAATLVAVLAVLAMYGLLNETVLRRRHEIGLRMAVGALPAGVRNRFIRHGVFPAGAGFVVGLAAVAALSRVVSAFLYEVAPFDPGVVAAIGGVVLALAVTASWIPADRATRIDPARCLSAE